MLGLLGPEGEVANATMPGGLAVKVAENVALEGCGDTTTKASNGVESWTFNGPTGPTPVTTDPMESTSGVKVTVLVG